MSHFKQKLTIFLFWHIFSIMINLVLFLCFSVEEEAHEEAEEEAPKDEAEIKVGESRTRWALL